MTTECNCKSKGHGSWRWERFGRFGLVETLGVLRLRLRMTPLLKKVERGGATATAKTNAGILHCVQNDGGGRVESRSGMTTEGNGKSKGRGDWRWEGSDGMGWWRHSGPLASPRVLRLRLGYFSFASGPSASPRDDTL
jgi:hypothetical protein